MQASSKILQKTVNFIYSQNLSPIFCTHNAACDLLLSGHNNQIILSLADSIHSLTTRENCTQTVQKKKLHPFQYRTFGQVLVQSFYIGISTRSFRVPSRSPKGRLVENSKIFFTTSFFICPDSGTNIQINPVIVLAIWQG